VGDDGVVRLQDLYQQDPVRILFPTIPRNEIPSAVFVTTSGGLVGGDVLELTAQVNPNAAARYYPQAAEKVYRSSGFTSQINVSLTAAKDAWLEWLPQETILFDDARLERKTIADVATGARLLAGEMLVLGRGAMGESVKAGLLRDEWEVRRDGRLVWADSLSLDDDIEATIAHPAGLGGATALATVVYVAEDAPDHLEYAREQLGDSTDVRSGATVVNGILIIRFMAAEPHALRQAYGKFWAEFRHHVSGYPATLPRLWHI